MQYRYYKGAAKEGVWKPIGTDLEESRIKAPANHFITVLTVNERAGPGESVSDDAMYQGPFYLDFDSDEIKKSIAAVKITIKKLLKNEVPREAIRVWATGKRGFHILIEQSCLTDDKPIRKLPLAYKFMMTQLKLPEKETDHTVYSCGKGRMWRIPNKKREDNQKFKVAITVQEALDMTPELYDSLVSQPRELQIPVYKAKVPFLQGLFALSNSRAQEAEKPAACFLDPDVIQGLEGQLPPCLELLLDGRDLNEDQGYNAISMQAGKGIAAFGPERSKELIDRLAQNVNGKNTYNTPEKRRKHTTTAVNIAKRAKGYEWSCRSMLTCLKDDECCDSCPIAFVRVEQDDEIEDRRERAEAKGKVNGNHKEPVIKEVDEGPDEGHSPDQELPQASEPEAEADEEDEREEKVARAPTATEGRAYDRELARAAQQLQDGSSGDGGNKPPKVPKDSSSSDDQGPDELGNNQEGLMAADDGYRFMTAEGMGRRVSNFTLNIVKVFLEHIPNLEEERRTGVLAYVFREGRRVGKVMLEDNAWNSKSSFISNFQGIANCAFYGKDDDVQRMKSALMADIESNVENIRRVYSIGIHHHKVDEDESIFTYVEPGWSIDQYGNQDKYSLSGHVAGHPRLKNVSLPKKGDVRLTQILNALMHTNLTVNVAQILGWFMADFLKQHVFAYNNQFPLLGLNGNRGSGKSSLATLFARLHGVDYRNENSSLSLPQATPFVMWKTIADTMTVPRIMEEYNKSKITRNFDSFGEVLKDCWNQLSVQRGTLSSKASGANRVGAHIAEFPLTAPVVVISEQSLTMPALVQRVVQVHLAEAYLDKNDARKNYKKVAENISALDSFAKACYMMALRTPISQVREWVDFYEDKIPLAMGDRPHYSYRIMLMGLDFLRTVLKAYEIDLIDRVDELTNELIGMVNDDIDSLAAGKQRSEIDIVIDTMAQMAALTEGDMPPWLIHGQHYKRDEDYLVIDALVAHAQYLSFMSRIRGAPAVIDNFREFRTLLAHEPYCDSINWKEEGFARERPVVRLAVAKLRKKGIEVDAFLTADQLDD